MLFQDLNAVRQLERMVGRMTSNSTLREELMQEAIVHLWRIQEERPGQTTNWYLQNCRYNLQHYLTAGRSVDSLKRRASQVVVEDGEDEDFHWDRFVEWSNTVFSHVSARDILRSLLHRLSEREKEVLFCLLEGMGLREIARRLNVSHPMVIKYRRRIADLARKLALEPLGGGRMDSFAR